MSIMDEIRNQLDDDKIGQLATQLGAGQQQTAQAIGAALPMLLAGLARNSNRSASGAGALAAALERDHDPSLLDQLGGLGSLLGAAGGSGGGGLGDLLGGLLGGAATGAAQPKAIDGGGILGHIFGERRSTVEDGLARSSGLDLSQVAKLLPLLAPLVMSALAKLKQQQNLDPTGLATTLERERREVESRATGLDAGALGSMLDRDHDGQIADDIAGIGADLAAAFFRR